METRRGCSFLFCNRSRKHWLIGAAVLAERGVPPLQAPHTGPLVVSEKLGAHTVLGSRSVAP